MNQLKDSIEDKCGILGIHTVKPTLNLPLALLAAAGLQHRGQHGAGIAMQTENGLKRFTGTGLLKDAFTKDVIEKFTHPSFWTMVHLRYGTSGDYIDHNLQPIQAKAPNGNIVSVIHNGEFPACDKMKNFIKDISIPEGASDTYLFTNLLAQSQGDNWDEKICSAVDKVTGAFSLIIGVNNSLYALRDRWGIRPLIMGRLNGGWVFASETHSLSKINVKAIRRLKRGEIVKVDENGLSTIRNGTAKPGNFCDFEWAYFSRPNSEAPTRENDNDLDYPAQWISFSLFRKRCGEALAKEMPITNASFVVGVPDSGVALATGYAYELRLPYAQVILRDHFDPYGLQRLFMRDDKIETISQKVLGKLSLVPDPQVWKDAIVVIGDDSIVRGNVSKKLTQAIFKLGAKEVHWMVGFPPVAYPCHLGVSMRTRDELIAAQFDSNPKKIARAIGATSVNYISPEGFIQSRKASSKLIKPENPKEIFLANGGCAGCITGLYPILKDGSEYPRYTT
ncbi:hypothetical protein A3C23_00200 [Candidatus Roizmanbacteria bacterium RIFCSPHIGHO2_02_FULL_37_13b]|uniref:Amidophosphoribosyltransferase n=1 Tax=Candidatus Roizmanbacteria bacterium RIFCSPLOWO2_02_FULL_36_11 TaxID=1802071 RepID=A0A1F7JHP2_9BACT|nr:MAG: hypothetical protein A3C23_00200 [Candidatus Roizmanbacteria bacterium RIFCSPHIGHO2_02_FULL_37_13b]OGK55120.1 MAG: hypothetical protein A3H78_04010 [Candidatus Roizmanbacteria bacterium RIFCSPLOWO2_02_FULL_36_11]